MNMRARRIVGATSPVVGDFDAQEMNREAAKAECKQDLGAAAWTVKVSGCE